MADQEFNSHISKIEVPGSALNRHCLPDEKDYSDVSASGKEEVPPPAAVAASAAVCHRDTLYDCHADAEKPLGCSFHGDSTLQPGQPTWFKQVFSPRLAELQLEGVNLRPLPFEEDASDAAHGKNKLQTSLWRNMATDVSGGCRRLISGTAQQIGAINLVARNAPNFGPLCDIFVQALGASLLAKTPLSIPPILLLGPPGIGKTHVSTAIANALDTAAVTLSMTTITAVNPLGGTALVWRDAKPGLVAKALMEGKTASPVFILDEMDKAYHQAGEADPLAPLHVFLEAQTAGSFRDEFLDVPVAADALIWIATANSLASIAPSIIDRMLVLQIPAPDCGQMRAVIAAIFAAAIATYFGWFDPVLSPLLLDQLAKIHPRQVKRVLALACQRAASQGNRELTTADIEAALSLVGHVELSRRAGFLA